MRDDPKIKALRKKFGCEGYAVWCMLLELLTAQEGFVYKWDELRIELAAGDFGLESKRLVELTEYMMLLQLVAMKDHTIFCPKLTGRFSGLLAKRNRDNIRNESKKEAKKGEKEVFASDNTYTTPVFAGEKTQSKVKESKGKKKQFTPPSFSEFSKYFTENNYPIELAHRAFEGYATADWHDSKGKAVKNWKQKCHHVWFKPENKAAAPKKINQKSKSNYE